MDLASFEMVRDYRSHLIDLLKSGNIDLCFANEDEARELISEAHGRNANRVILYEDAAKKQLQEFIASLRGCEAMIQACSSLYSILTMTESTLLHHLLTPGKGLPDMSSVIENFKDTFDWSEANSSGHVIPHAGGECEYDAACQRMKEVESNLVEYLKEQRKILGNSEIN